jgi:hypothetical protein
MLNKTRNTVIWTKRNWYSSVWVTTGADLASSARRGAGFPWGGAWGSLTAHSPLQFATLLSQHFHYLWWPNLHVRRSVTFYIIFCL